ncbi:MAG: dihydropteroate synthase [Actinomycetaceae bacterium]|nr:dihydropteroate synthase [Arcanobacterium sp.]MDD7687004.1 dihydropteroate synthase [Actinomycetaceae bacterium]MDY5273340.1 dihydropteroate synthase [Arcanobacterium sp.]
MGIVNVTPDSFSDGGLWSDADAAITHGRELIEQGASILDIGGESTRPGATMLEPSEEWERIHTVVTELAANAQAALSVDTYHAVTAARAVQAGATIVNDVTGGQGDSDMFATVADLECDYILQHGRGNPQTMNSLERYSQHVAIEVHDELLRQRDAAVAAGIAPERIILDPGLGFAKTGDHDWDAIAGLELIMREGHRVLVGASRKRFIAGLSAPLGPNGADRDVATAVISGLLSELGIWGVRVHNVAASIVAIRVHEQMHAASKRWQEAQSA